MGTIITVSSFVFLLLLGKNYSVSSERHQQVTCNSPQYLELANVGMIDCSFDKTFFGVLWYNTTDYAENDPVLHHQDLTTTGAGYESGEYDIHQNGSLIINNVSESHENIFTVAYIHKRKERAQFFQIAVIVIVKPKSYFPVINVCSNSSRLCFWEGNVRTIVCSVHGVRPNISLNLMSRTIDGDRNISSDTKIELEGYTFTSYVTSTNVFQYTRLLVLLVCKASSPPGILRNTESIVLTLNHDSMLSLLGERTVTYIESHSRVELICLKSNVKFVIWKKVVNGDISKSITLLYSVSAREEFSKVFSDEVTLGSNGSMVIRNASVSQEGLYICIYGDGKTEGVTSHEIIIFVRPDPPFPIIGGCDVERYCVLEVELEGIVTCTMKRIRPQVQLSWRTVYEDDASFISFEDHLVTVKNNGDTFDVSLMSKYVIVSAECGRLTIECKAVHGKNISEYLSTRLDLVPVEGTVNGNVRVKFLEIWVTVLSAAFVFCTMLLLMIISLKTCRRKKNKKRASSEEEMEMMSTSQYSDNIDTNIQEKKKKFTEQLKEKYQCWYNSVKPIPYVKDRLYCVETVFVECGINYLFCEGSEENEEKWDALKSYQNIFNDDRVRSSRRILEGEPGYGKSTITLQLAYDWCNSKPTSALKDVEILILLRLRQLGGVKSVYSDIKRFLLPKDTHIAQTDIKRILQSCSSVVVLLDGYDEYPDQERTKTGDIKDIIERQMFFDFEVVTTTRSSCLPERYPSCTKRMKLIGFDDDARSYYIRKAVVGDNNEKIKIIEGYLQDNPILSDLCQVPLLFVIFVHMTYEHEHFRQLNSVTAFFYHMVKCFHSHMRNKTEDENVPYYELESNHSLLDKVAFEALNRSGQKIVWQKEELRSQISYSFYELYVRIGILVEEDVVDTFDNSIHQTDYKKEVRFYHKLFCEWYAASYISSYASKNPLADLDKFLQNLNPLDVQYVYRFTCGLNQSFANKLIEHLIKIKGGSKCAVLCLLEVDGKTNEMKDTIRQLCEGVIISHYDNLLLQRATLKLLQEAGKAEVEIKYLILSNCLESVNESNIITESGLHLPSHLPITKLKISLTNRDITPEETIAILRFSCKCTTLKRLWFDGCVFPEVVNDKGTLSALQANGLTVGWQLLSGTPWYVLDLEIGRWKNEKDGKELDDSDFRMMYTQCVEAREGKTKRQYKEEVEIRREYFRQTAKDQQAKNKP